MLKADDSLCFVPFQNGPKIVLDHWLIYHAHYEMGSIYQRREEWAEAASHFEVVMSGQFTSCSPLPFGLARLTNLLLF